jgi:hypothetical protein
MKCLQVLFTWFKLFAFFIGLTWLFSCPIKLMAQEWWEVSVPNSTFDVPDPVWTCPTCGLNIVCPDGNCPPHNCKAIPSNSSQNSGTSNVFIPTTEQQIQLMLVQGLVTWLFTPAGPTAQEQAAAAAQLEAQQAQWQQQQAFLAAQEAERQAQENKAFQQLMQMTKTLPDGKADLDFQTLNGSTEQLSSEAAMQFLPETTEDDPVVIDGGTPFFGDMMTQEQIMTVMMPESNPIYLDVMTADALMVASLKEAEMPFETEVIQDSTEDNGEPIVEKLTPEQCTNLVTKYNKYVYDMQRFNKWNNTTKIELEKWKKSNDEAFWAAVNEGLTFSLGMAMEYAVDQAKKASRIAEVLTKEKASIAARGKYSPERLAQIQQVLDKRMSLQKFNITTGKLADFGGNMQTLAIENTEYVQNLIHGMSTLIMEGDAEYNAFCDYLVEEGYLSEWPKTDLANFLAQKEIDAVLKAKGFTRIPYVSIASTIVNQTYNAMQFYYSFQNITTLNEADGNATEAVIQIENQMRSIEYTLSSECHITKQ